MMQQQRIIKTNLGNDTHVRRDYTQDAFRKQGHSCYANMVGEVLYPQPEPAFRNNMVTVKLANGGSITNVAYPGAFIEPTTGNMHGLYEGPIPGQMVMVGFENGNQNSPFVVNRYPYQGRGNTLTEAKYSLPLTTAGYNCFDIVLGHFSGSFISLNTGGFPSTKTPGSMTLSAMTEMEFLANTSMTFSALSQEINSTTTIALNSTLATTIKSSTDIELQATALLQLKSATQSMKTLIDNLFNIMATGVIDSGTYVFNAATQALITAELAKWALLLKA